MKRIVRLTEQDLTGLLKGIVDLALGGTANNKKEPTSTDEKEPTSKDEKKTTSTDDKKSDTPTIMGIQVKFF